MQPSERVRPQRRWTNRSLALVAVATSLGAAILTLSLIGLGRTMSALTRFAPAAAEQISPESPETTFVPATNVTADARTGTTDGQSAPPDGVGGMSQDVPALAAVSGRGGTLGGGGRGGAGGVGGEGLAGVAGVGGGGGVGGALPTSGVACGTATCRADQRCCNASCGICTAADESCTKQLCGVPNVSTSVLCGPNTCNVGQVCCNASCGVCTAPGASCDQAECAGAPRPPSNERCGTAICNDGLVCCNASCGICAPPGQSCSHEICS